MRGAASAFLAGAGVMTVEVLGSRWLAPVFGFTLTTWAWLISATLLAGAIGAALGGRPAPPGRDRVRAGIAFVVAGIWLGLDGLFAPAVLEWLLPLPVGFGAALGAVAIVAIPVLALSTAVPRVAAEARGRTGPIVGRLLAASTAGSLAGTLVSALVLVPGPGLRAGGLLVGAALVLFGALSIPQGRRRVSASLAALALSVLAIGPDGGGDRVRESGYGRIEIVPVNGGYSLRVDGIAQTGYSALADGRGALLARRQYFELLPYLHPRGETALHIGLGAGLVPRTLASHGIETISVELDPEIVSLARERLGFEGEVVIGDGRVVLRRLDERFDFLILDAFRGESTAVHLLTREAFEEASRHLEDGGVVCIHLIARPGGEAVASVARTLAEVLPETLAVRSGIGDGYQHVFLFASARPLRLVPHPDLDAAGWLGNEIFTPDLKSGHRLTDDRNPLPGLLAAAARALRLSSR